MYRLDEPGEFKNLVDLQYASVISHPTGGKNDIPNRLRRHCSTFDVPLPTDTSLRQISGVTFSSRFRQTDKRGSPQYAREVQQLAEKLTSTTIQCSQWSTGAPVRRRPAPSG